MPVTKTAKRALRVAKKKLAVNKIIISALEVAIREAKRSKGEKAIKAAISLADRAAKKHVVHKNKANRIKQTLMKLLPKKKTATKTTTKAKKSSKKK